MPVTDGLQKCSCWRIHKFERTNHKHVIRYCLHTCTNSILYIHIVHSTHLRMSEHASIVALRGWFDTATCYTNTSIRKPSFHLRHLRLAVSKPADRSMQAAASGAVDVLLLALLESMPDHSTNQKRRLQANGRRSEWGCAAAMLTCVYVVSGVSSNVIIVCSCVTPNTITVPNVK